MNDFNKQNSEYLNKLKSIKVDDLEKELNELERIKDGILKKLDCSETKTKSAQVEIAEYNKIKNESEERQRQIIALQGELTKLAKQLKDCKTEGDVKSVNDRTQKLISELQGSQKNYQNTIRELNAQVADLKKQTKNTSNKPDTQKLNMQIESLNTEKNRLITSLNESKRRTEELEFIESQLRNKLKTDGVDIQKDLTNVKNQLKETQDQLTSEKRKVELLQNKCGTLRDKAKVIVDKESEKLKEYSTQLNIMMEQRNKLLDLYKAMAVNNNKYGDRLRNINKELMEKLRKC